MQGSPAETRTPAVVFVPARALQKSTASCPVPAAGQPSVQPFELPSTHVSAGVRQKAEAEASGLFNAFLCDTLFSLPGNQASASLCSPCRNEAPCQCFSVSASALLRAKQTLPQSFVNSPPEDLTLILATSAAARFAHILQ